MRASDGARPLATPQGRATARLRHSLRYFSFAPQRFESFCGPMVRNACLLNPTGILSSIVGAHRDEGCAVARGSVLGGDDGPGHPGVWPRGRLRGGLPLAPASAAGPGGSSGQVTKIAPFSQSGEPAADLPKFLRLYDSVDHDPARTTAELRDFLASVQALFVEGYVLLREQRCRPHHCRARADYHPDRHGAVSGAPPPRRALSVAGRPS